MLVDSCEFQAFSLGVQAKLDGEQWQENPFKFKELISYWKKGYLSKSAQNPNSSIDDWKKEFNSLSIDWSREGF